MPELLPDVQPDLTADAPNPQDFESYVARRQADAAPAEPDPVDDAPELAPEPAASEPAKPETPAAEATPPEPAPASEPVIETQEQKVEREKKAGIPQSRFDEVTKARRDAERERDSERDRAVKAERELAELKAKPAEPVKPPEPAPKPPEAAKLPEAVKPVMPDPPTLEDKDGDWDAYQAANKEYYTKTLPEFQDKLTDWKLEQRELAQQKAARERHEADTRAKTEAAQKTAREAEELAAKSWNERYAQVKTEHPDIDEKIAKTPGSAAMISAVQDSDNGAELLVWLTDHPEESKRIADLTGSGKQLTPPETRRAIAKAHLEFAKLDVKASAAAPPVPVTPPAAAPPAVAEQPPKPPENPKPAVSRAPKPPAVVSERSNGTSDPKDAALKGDFDAYEQRRMAQSRR